MISNVAVLLGGKTYQLCQPSNVKVSAAVTPKYTHTALPSGRTEEPGEPYFSMSVCLISKDFRASRLSHSSAWRRSDFSVQWCGVV